MLAALAVAAVACGLAPAPALAASVVTVVSDARLEVNGDAGTNDVTFSHDEVNARLVFAETGISTTSGTCTDTGDTVRCPVPPGIPDPLGSDTPPVIYFALGDGADTLTYDGSITGLYQYLTDADGGEGADMLSLGATADTARGGPGGDTISTGPGRDTIEEGPGADTISGGGDDDLVSYRDRTTGVILEPNGQPTSGNEEDGLAEPRDTIAADVEDLVGGRGDDVLIGTTEANLLRGLEGQDSLIGRKGGDTLEGDAGRGDRLLAGPGDDFLTDFRGFGDVLSGGPGDDRIADEGGRGDRLLGGRGIDHLMARDRRRDAAIRCGAGSNRRESATRDRIDPRARSC
jgi:Ca2+-binding RTX toxin-like protein